MLNFVTRLRDRREEGFSLVELMVAIAIMGILAAIAVPAYLNQRKTAIDATLVSDIKSAATTIETALSSVPEARCVNSTQVGTTLTIRLYAALPAATTPFACSGTAISTSTSFLSVTDNLLVASLDPYSVNGYQLRGTNARGTSTAIAGFTYLSNKGGFQ